jgi:hypothetical protein
MSRLIRPLMILLVIMLGLIVTHSNFHAAEGKAKWTLLLYLNGDCDLEARLAQKLEQLAEISSTEEVHLVVLMDRSPYSQDDHEYYSNQKIANAQDWVGCKFFHLENERLRELDDWGNTNLGDPKTLEKFIELAIKKYPAEKYGLIFAGYGDGWKGFIPDETSDGDVLNINELASVLKNTKKSYGEKLELIGFDCSHMASLEVAYAIAPYAKFMVASEGLQSRMGWDYGPFATRLVKTPEMSASDLGLLIAKTYQEYYTKANDDVLNALTPQLTLSVIDLDQVADLMKTFNKLADQWTDRMKVSKRKEWVRLAKARSQTERYGILGEDGPPSSVDVTHFAENVRSLLPDQTPPPEYDSLKEAIKKTVIHQIRGECRPHASGLSVFFPSSGSVLPRNLADGYMTLEFAQKNRWLPFLKQYIKTSDNFSPSLGLRKVEADGKSITRESDETIEFTSKVDLPELNRATFVLASTEEKQKYILGEWRIEPEEKGKLSQTWDGKWLLLGNLTRHAICPSIITFPAEKKETYLARIQIQCRHANQEEWMDATAFFFISTQDKEVTGKLISIYRDSSMGPKQIMPLKNDEIRPVYQAMNDKGEKKYIPSMNPEEVITLNGPGDLKIIRGPIPKGTYRLGFQARDFSGNAEEQDVEIEIR